MANKTFLEPQVLEQVSNRYQNVVDSLIDEYRQIVRESLSVFDEGWQGNTAKSHQNVFEEWSDLFQDSISQVSKLREDLVYANTTLSGVDQDNAVGIDSSMDSIVDLGLH